MNMHFFKWINTGSVLHYYQCQNPAHLYVKGNIRVHVHGLQSETLPSATL